MRATAIAALLLVSALPSTAQTSRPPLVPNTSVNSEDSALVKAAKMAVAARTGTGKAVDLTPLTRSGGRIAFASQSSANVEYSGQAEKSLYPGAGVNTDAPQPGPPPVDRAEAQRKLDNLAAEQGRMAFESEQPYGGDYSEGHVEQRMTQIPQEQKTLQQQLNQPAPPPPPPNQQ